MTDTSTLMIFKGLMSPERKMTLPQEVKKLMGIHDEATTFAFIHIPADLADQIIWSECGVNQSAVKDGPNTWTIP